MIEYIIITLLIFLIICVLIMIFKFSKNSTSFDEAELSRNINAGTVSAIKQLGDLLAQNQKNVNEFQTSKINQLNSDIKQMQQSVEKQLEQVYRGFGEMQTMASSMTDLKKMLSNVKTRGILGEITLGSILDEVMSPEQFDTNVVTIPGSFNRVEFAVKLPHEEEGFIYLPIDSKFPLDAYYALQDAYDDADAEKISVASKLFVSRIKQFAKDIHTKYVEPPYTTDFAIMFLPLESLYAEVINSGLIEVLQREYKINIAGPSTMAAMLNALQMGFKTLALEKKTAQVWEILEGIKIEFEKFEAGLTAAKNHISQAEKDIENLIGTRSRAILKKLNSIESTKGL